MKFRFKVSKDWWHTLQYKRCFIWNDYNKSYIVSHFIFQRYNNANILRYHPNSELQDDDYREFIKRITKERNDYCKKVKEYKRSLKTDYYIN